jgi:hypothetical protein
MPPNLKVCLLESIYFISIGLYVCFWKVGNVGVGVYLSMFESIHYSESLIYIKPTTSEIQKNNYDPAVFPSHILVGCPFVKILILHIFV